MKLIAKGITFLVGVCVLAGAAQAADGLLLVQKTTSGTTVRTNRVQIERTRMRTESTDPSGAQQVMIFDGAKKVLTTIDVGKKTYREMTEADVEKMGAQMSGAMAQLQEQMKNMTPEQRAMMEKMSGRMGAAMAGMGAPVKVQYRKAGTDTVGKWKCDKYEGFKGEEKTSEICTVDPKVLGFAATDFEVSKQMAEFFKKMVPQMAEQMARQAFTLSSPEEQGFSGVPVRTSITVAGRQVTTEIVEAGRQTFPDAAYQVPAGFQKLDFMAGPGRGRGRD